MRIGIVGCGTMGQGIAQLAATAGEQVVVFDRVPAAVSGLHPAIERILKRRVEKGALKSPDVKRILSLIGTAASLADFSSCDLVIEAVTEDLSVKTKLLQDLERHTSSDCILATNTSSLAVTSIAGACKNAGRVVGVHFFNPAPLMPLVEIVQAVQSSESALARSEEMVKRWGKTPIRVKDTPAFVVNRIARPFYGESLRLLDEGVADAATIDWALQHFGQFRMGPFELMDFIGIDVNYAVTLSVFESFYFDSRYRPSLTQKRLVEAGHLGRKSGKGFYAYGEGAEKPEPRSDAQLGAQIFERVRALLVNEAIEAVFWGIASPGAIEQAMTLGMNFPKGLLQWGEEFGLSRILGQLEQLHREYGEERYRPSVLLKRMVSRGEHFFKIV